MKIKLMMIALMMCLSTFSFGQWSFKVINSEFDGEFKKATTETYNNGYLTMEVRDPLYNNKFLYKPFLALIGSYFCDDYTYIDIVLIVNDVNKKYKLKGTKSRDSRMYYFDESIWTDEFIKDFKGASRCSIRVNQDYCQDDYYMFNFSNSEKAYSFINRFSQLVTNDTLNKIEILQLKPR